VLQGVEGVVAQVRHRPTGCDNSDYAAGFFHNPEMLRVTGQARTRPVSHSDRAHLGPFGSLTR
jgi:hypothetical protein